MGGTLKYRFLLLTALLLAGGAVASTPEQDAAWGDVQQGVLPGLQGRQSAAEAAVEARAAWLAGNVSFEEAYPHLAGAPLDREAALRGRLRALEDAAIARWVERESQTKDLGSATRNSRLEEVLAGAHAAESESDLVEKQLLIAVLARLTQDESLNSTTLEDERTRLRERAGEGGSPELEAAALEADQQLRRLDALVNHILRASAGTPLSVDVDAELAALGDHAHQALRLSLLWPVVGGESQERIGTSLAAWWKDRPAPEYSEAELSRIERALAAPDPDGEPWKVARSDTLKQWLAQLVSVRDGAEQPLADDAGDTDLAQVDADRAVEEAEAARAEAEDVLAQRRADLNVGLARSRKRVASIQDRVAERDAAADEIAQEINNELALFQADVRALGERRRKVDADASYRRARELSSRLRENSAAWGEPLNRARSIATTIETSVEMDRRQIADAQGLVRSTSDVLLQEQLRSQLEIWAGQLELEAEGAEALVDAATRERDAVLHGLGGVREARRALYPWISRAERDSDYRFLFEDIIQELSLLGPSVLMRIRERGEEFLAIPGKLTNYKFVRSVVFAGFWLVLGLTLWAWTRGQANETARVVCDRIRAVRPELRRSDMVALRDPVARFLRATVDLLLGYLLVSQLGNDIPEAGLLLRVYLQLVLFRALMAGFDLSVVPLDQVRPAVMLLRRDAWDLGRKSFAWIVGLLIARRFAAYLLWDVLGLDIVAGLVAYGFWLALLAAALRLLHLWQPFLQRRVRRRNQDTPVVAFLAKDPENPLVRAPRSVGILTFFAADMARNLLWILGSERSGFAWLIHAVGRFRDDTETERFVGVEDSVAEAISGGDTEPDYWLDRPELGPEIASALVAWREEDRRGLVAVVGDRGCGKRTACIQVADLVRDSGLNPTECELIDHLVTEAHALEWLSNVAGVPVASSPADLVTALDGLPRQAFVLRGLHRAWSRRVEGFAAIKTLLYVLNATCDTHFWVVSMHSASWEFFAASGSSVDVGVFRTVVALQPLNTEQLRELTVGRTERAGYRLDFSGLVRSSPFGGDQAVEEERGVHMFFRLLSEASDGCARVALSLWARCLVPTDDPEVLQVRIHPSLTASGVLALPDAALFALVALRIQDELNEDELQEVTNLPPHVVRSTIRDLMSRGMVEVADDRFSIPDLLLPVVTRTLRRRHFLHVGV